MAEPDLPSKESFGEKADSTQAMRRIYAKRYSDYIEDMVSKLWAGELSHEQALFLVKTIGDPTRRDMYLRVLWWAQKNPEGVVKGVVGLDGKRVRYRIDLLGPEGSRVFKEALTSDLFADAQESLQRAGFGDLLSALAYRIGSHQGIRDIQIKAKSTADLFED